MNKKVFGEILSKYKEKYDYINDPASHDEIYKFPAVKCCIDHWNIDAEDFPGMLKESMAKSLNIIENRIKHPINGLTFLCEQGKAGEVREEFRKLFLDDGGDIRKRQKKAEEFVDNINAMLNEIAPEKWSFTQDRRDALMYLAFINPAGNYMFKAEPARVFANYVEFGDDIGSGQTFRLDNYYRLCDEVLEEIEKDAELLELLDRKLVERAKVEGLEPEALKNIEGKLRIVVYDIMYCANAYILYEGIAKPAKKGSKEEKEQIRRKRVTEILTEIEEKDTELSELLKDVPEYPNLEGAELTNIKYGKGRGLRQNGKYLYIGFGEDEKTFALPDCISKGYLKGADESVVVLCKALSEITDKQEKLAKSLRNLKVELSGLE